jgi:hypothetical protein
LISAHQNDLKTQKIYQFEAKKKNKKVLNFFKSVFETQKQTGFYETHLKKHVKTISQKLCFKLNFLVGLAVQTQFGLLANNLLRLFQRKRKSW